MVVTKPSLLTVKKMKISNILRTQQQLYYVARSRTNNLPVYTEYKRGNQISTIIRKIDGDSKVCGGSLLLAHLTYHTSH